MSSKLKKLIISLVALVLAGVLVLVGVTILTKLSTSTVYDLKIVENVEDDPAEINKKEVYLLSPDKNFFLFKLSTSASSILSYRVYSSNEDIATVTHENDDVYSVNYFKTGEVDIIATTSEKSNIKDSFKLVVKENLPNEFNIDVDQSNNLTIDSSHVQIFADTKEYSFIFSAYRGNLDENINIGGLNVLDDYNKNVFSNIYIRTRTIISLDPDTNTQVSKQVNELVLSAKQSEETTSEIVTIQSKYNGEDGTTLQNFVIKVDVKGNYINDIQLVVSQTPNFDDCHNIYGEGLIKDDEFEVKSIYLTEEINSIYVKVRVVYTNGDIILADDDVVTAEEHDGSGTITDIPKEYGNYYKIETRGYFAIRCVHNDSKKEELFQFNYLDESNQGALNNFYDTQLYRKIVDQINEEEYFEYIYWDTRFMRDDAVVLNGKIRGFVGGDPKCEEIVISKPASGEENDNSNASGN